MIGVNCVNHEPDELKDIMTREELNWRSFADDGAIMRQWNFPATPTFYVIDHRGMIRHKWAGNPGEKSLDTALAKLIRIAEAALKPK